MRVLQPDQLTRPAMGHAGGGAGAGAGAGDLAAAAAGAGGSAGRARLARGRAAGFALLAGAAVWDLAAPDWIAAGWLGIALALAFAARRLGDLALGTAAVLVILCGVARALWTVPELSFVSLDALLGDPVLAANLPDARHAISALAVPAVLLAAIRLILPPLPMRARMALPILAGIFAAIAAYLLFKQVFGLADQADFVAARPRSSARSSPRPCSPRAGCSAAAGCACPGSTPDGLRLAGTLAHRARRRRGCSGSTCCLFNPAFAEQMGRRAAGPQPDPGRISARRRLALSGAAP